jgi:hypothetical protein
MVRWRAEQKFLLRRGAQRAGNCEKHVPLTAGFRSQNIRTPKTGQEVEDCAETFAAEYRGAWTEQIGCLGCTLAVLVTAIRAHPEINPRGRLLFLARRKSEIQGLNRKQFGASQPLA